MIALFPIPVRTIFPVDLNKVLTNLTILSSIAFERFFMELDSKAKVSYAIFFISVELVKMSFLF